MYQAHRLNGHKLHALTVLPLGKEPPVAIRKEAGWAPERLSRENSLAPAGNRTPASSPYPVAIPTELSRHLNNPGSCN
jgi:hypothetical protein